MVQYSNGWNVDLVEVLTKILIYVMKHYFESLDNVWNMPFNKSRDFASSHFDQNLLYNKTPVKVRVHTPT